jgi:hypothetical protein
MHEHSKRRSSHLLFGHEHIVSNLLNTLHLWETIQTELLVSIVKRLE